MRTLNSPPFEVSETGWGEFEVGISVEFVDSAAAPAVEFTHGLKLHHDADVASAAPLRPVIRDRYDEFLFVAPPQAFQDALARHMVVTAAPSEIEGYGSHFALKEEKPLRLCTVQPQSEADELVQLARARQAVAQLKMTIVQSLSELGPQV